MTADPGTLLGLLADERRLKVVAALALDARTRADVVARTGLTTRAVAQALTRLEAGGLVDVVDDRYRLRTDDIGAAARALGQAARASDEHADAPDDAAKVLRRFVKDGRLTSIPAQHNKRLVILDWLAQRFEPGEIYPERTVNLVIGKVHDDVAALRRYLVDDEFLERREGFYWRAGGSFEL
jgi:hypothetical protein